MVKLWQTVGITVNTLWKCFQNIYLNFALYPQHQSTIFQNKYYSVCLPEFAGRNGNAKMHIINSMEINKRQTIKV